MQACTGQTCRLMQSMKIWKRAGGMRYNPERICRCTGLEFSMNKSSAMSSRSRLSHSGASPSEIAHTLLHTPCM